MPARVRLTLVVAAALVLLGTAAVFAFGGGSSGKGDGLRGFQRGNVPAQDFTLRDQDGKTVSLRRHRGQVVVLTFMYSTCRDTCPVTAQDILGALDDVGHDVPALAVSVDPKNDTPRTAKAFLLKQHLTHRMQFLLGTRAQLAPVWHDYYIQPQGNGYEHSAYVLLIDKQGRQRESFPVQQLVSEDLAHDIRLLEQEPA
jgi:protein SCO1